MVENSGWGWEHFGLRTEGREGHVFVRSPLDYEDPQHRRGFTFMVQVTDRVSGKSRENKCQPVTTIEVVRMSVNRYMYQYDPKS